MWTIFKVFTEFVTILLLFYVLVFWPGGMWDLSSPTRDRTRTPCIGRQSLNHWTASFPLLITAPQFPLENHPCPTDSTPNSGVAPWFRSGYCLCRVPPATVTGPALYLQSLEGAKDAGELLTGRGHAQDQANTRQKPSGTYRV